MKDVLRTLFEILLVALVLVGTLTGFYWILRDYFGLSREGVILLLLPTALLSGLMSIYGYYMGWERRRSGGGKLPPKVVFAHVLRLFLLALLVLVPALLTVYLFYRENYKFTTLLGMVSIIISVWAFRTIQKEMRRLEMERARLNGSQRLSWPLFERRFRIFVFGLILALPVGLSLFSLVLLQDIAETILFAVIAIVVAPWAIYKIASELRGRSR